MGRNNLNVYSGPQSVREFFDPECQPPLPLVEIPDCLNPNRADGVRIYAKMMSMHPATNVKVMPAMNLLEKGVEPGKTKTIVESSSGSTVISMAMVARAFHGIDDVHAYLSNKTSQTKVRLMQFFGLDVTLFGGPAQPTPVDERGGIRAASRKAMESDSVCSPNQYQNDNNWKAHERWTAPQIHQQLPDINVIAASMGTAGTMTGLGMYFGKAKPSVYRIAVCTDAGDRVPGPREFSLMSEVKFPYKSAVDVIEEVGSKDSYSLSLDLTRQGIVCGPSSGFTLQGLLQRIEKKKQDGTLSQLAGPNGEINCVFMCCDLPFQYLNEYFDKLGPEKFRPVRNERLRHVDLYRYDDAWEREAMDALSTFFTLHPTNSRDTALCLAGNCVDELERVLVAKPNTQILDFRRAADFNAFHLPNSVNIPLEVLKNGATRGSPFADPVGDCTMLEELWLELERLFTIKDKDGVRNPSAEALMAILRGKRILTMCYDGDSARVANSVLRAKGVDSQSVRGGFAALAKLHLPDTGSSQQSTRVVSVEA
ncbi:pyridoxal-phosphate dependent enzyme [Hirsutella rhossiliensis]|uniref:Pyridoxal-phosphate dependent enzyme domain-containing protein n=1 Tax=Hirsutella rhossiliensis TaxID=111463 RepID=A0A9P8SMV8_9HYPO|nr:pyridoxal-phosphate dependent enzyme domain-containing protein [Hirsutella rhossiliensis]KAH0967714.1 pyridoxal-phosphate dependent enzyme domain-containing protein [Hirsutella rhossiliensis]